MSDNTRPQRSMDDLTVIDDSPRSTNGSGPHPPRGPEGPGPYSPRRPAAPGSYPPRGPEDPHIVTITAAPISELKPQASLSLSHAEFTIDVSVCLICFGLCLIACAVGMMVILAKSMTSPSLEAPLYLAVAFSIISILMIVAGVVMTCWKAYRNYILGKPRRGEQADLLENEVVSNEFILESCPPPSQVTHRDPPDYDSMCFGVYRPQSAISAPNLFRAPSNATFHPSIYENAAYTSKNTII